MEQTLIIDSIESYNNYFGFETQHPLVAVVDLRKAKPESFPMEAAYDYRVYALFLKQTYCGDITYGRQPYDYQEGTVTSFAPGQVVHVKHMPHFEPNARGLLFHPDLIRGTSLGKGIGQYSFFDYSSREALHLSDDEKKIFTDCLNKIEMELGRPIDQHSKPLICRNIELLLDYCMRFYDRQFITRREANHDVLTRFENELNTYFRGNRAEREGLPSVKYFAERCFLSPNYFGDLVKKETGKSAIEYIHFMVINKVKDLLLGSDKTVSEIAYEVGFQYPHHLSRMFKKITGLTPNEYRKQAS